MAQPAWGYQVRPVPQLDPPPEPLPTLPIGVAIGALVVLTVSLIASKLVLDAVVGFEWPVMVYVCLLGLIGYGPSLAWTVYSSKRWGTGRIFRDVGLRPQWSDLGWGPLVWLCAVAGELAIAAVVYLFDIPIASNTEGVTEVASDRTYVISIVISAVVAAPLVEEIVFRGLILRGLLSRTGVIVAVVVQGVLFGAAHVDPVRGEGNIGLVMVLSAVGIVLGGAAYLLRRIGPVILAHAILNGVVMTLVLTGLSDRLAGSMY